MNAPFARARSTAAWFAAITLALALPAQDAVKDAPQNPPGKLDVTTLREQAAGAENRGEFAQAADLWLQLVAADPSRADFVLAAGRCLGSSGRFRDAIDLLEKKRAAFVPLTDLPALLARTYLLRVERDRNTLQPELDFQEAARLAEEVLVANPDHLDARMILAQARYSLFDAKGALAAAEEAIRRHPQHPGGHVLVGRIAFDDYRLLKDQFDAEKPVEPRHGELVTAIDAARKRAQTAFTRAAEIDSVRTYPLVMLGDIAARDRDVASALKHWNAALGIDPTARVDHGWIQEHTTPAQRREFYHSALAHYEAVANAAPARAAALRFYSGLALYAAQQWLEAKTEFAATRTDNASFINADYYGAMCAWRLGDEDGAETLAAAFAAASAPGFADVLRALEPEPRAEVAGIVRHLGDRAWDQGRRDQSRDLNHVIACLQDSADAWNNYAFLCRETKRFDAAFVGYQHAIEREPDSPQLWNDAAVVLHYHLASEANRTRARQMYGRAIELADQQLADATTSAILRQRAERAKADALANLKDLESLDKPNK